MVEYLGNNREMARPVITGENLIATIIDREIAIRDYDNFIASTPENLEEIITLERIRARACNRLDLLYMCSVDTKLQIESLEAENLVVFTENFSNIAVEPSRVITGQLAYPILGVKGTIRLHKNRNSDSHFIVKILDDNSDPIARIKILN